MQNNSAYEHPDLICIASHRYGVILYLLTLSKLPSYSNFIILNDIQTKVQ